MKATMTARRRGWAAAGLGLLLGLAVLGGGTRPAAAQGAPGGPGFDDRPPAMAGSPATARLDARITQLEQDLRGVTGRVETLSFQMRQLTDKLDRLSSDLEMRLEQLRTQGAAAGPGASAAAGAAAGGPRMLGDDRLPAAAPAPAAPATAAAPTSPPAPVTPPPPAPAPATTPPTAPQFASSKEQYAYAFALMQKANYAEAGTAFADFLRRYPDDALADNARYWLGESFYARGKYSEAAETFFDAYEKNKTGPKAPDTLLKLGMALASIDKKKEACASFRELARAFPNASTQVRDRAAQESKRLGCG
jgi:tol-pal system protein YbgF